MLPAQPAQPAHPCPLNRSACWRARTARVVHHHLVANVAAALLDAGAAFAAGCAGRAGLAGAIHQVAVCRTCAHARTPGRDGSWSWVRGIAVLADSATLTARSRTHSRCSFFLVGWMRRKLTASGFSYQRSAWQLSGSTLPGVTAPGRLRQQPNSLQHDRTHAEREDGTAEDFREVRESPLRAGSLSTPAARWTVPSALSPAPALHSTSDASCPAAKRSSAAALQWSRHVPPPRVH